MAGQTIADRYVLQQPLGGGAMSSVWLARDSELERDVAVKLLASAADRARFEREARAVASLAHPNICQLYDYGEAAQGPYMILEYLSGGTLEDRLAPGRPLPDDEAARIAHEIASALAYAHERGVVHRDLKPANVLFDGEGRAKIADFGIARIVGGEALTETGTVLGTAAYISPEQASGRPATPASDVYSFGAILYRMLTGQPPFASNSAIELVRMHQEQEPTPVERVRAGAPVALAALATAALAKDVAQRPRDGAALVAALAGAVEPTTILAGGAGAGAATAILGGAFAAPPTQVLPRTRPPRRRRAVAPLLLTALAVLLLAGIAAAVVLTGSDGSSGSPPPTGTINLPSVPAGQSSTSSTVASTTAPTTTAATAQESTAQTSTEATTSTQRTTTTRTTSTSTSASTSTAPAPPPPPTSTPAFTTSTVVTTTTAFDTTTTTPAGP